MIIEGEYHDPIELTAFNSIDGIIWQGTEALGIDKHQAEQLIEVLQRWIDGEEIE
nr:MAG TPA: hypothetical protein [Caudoviricetes sp.]